VPATGPPSGLAFDLRASKGEVAFLSGTYPNDLTVDEEIVYSRETMTKAQEEKLVSDVAELKLNVTWYWRAFLAANLIGLALFGIIYGWVFMRIPEQQQRANVKVVEPLTAEIAKLNADLVATRPDAAHIVAREMSESLRERDRTFGLQKIAALSDAAVDNRVRAPRAVIGAIGADVLATYKHGEALQWDTALRLARYTSALTESPESATGQTPVEIGSAPVYDLSRALPSDTHAVMWGATRAPEQSAWISTIQRYDRLFAELKNRQTIFSEWALVEYSHTAPITLDGFHIRNMVIKGANVHYGGGPVVLENVYFVDCTFTFDAGLRSREILTSFFSSPDVSKAFGT